MGLGFWTKAKKLIKAISKIRQHSLSIEKQELLNSDLCKQYDSIRQVDSNVKCFNFKDWWFEQEV